jgi:PAS domain S-box-containing protein
MYTQKILSVDDNETNNYLIKAYLANEGVEILLASGGHEALELIEKNQFSLILLDVMMSNMNGFELAKKIRRIKKCELIPIIFITAIFNDEISVIKGYELDAVDYLIKPIAKEILCQKARFFLKLDRQNYELVEQRNRLIESEKRFFDIANSINGWIWEVDVTGKYVYASEKVEEILGFRRDEIYGKSIVDLMTKESAKQLAPTLKKLALNKPVLNDIINWKYTKDGGKVCFLTTGVPIVNEENKLIGYRGVDKNITDKIKSEEELRFQAKLLQNVNDSIIFTDLEGSILYANNGTEYLFGYNKETLIDKTMALLFPEQYKDLLISELNVLIDFKPYQAVWQGKTSKGKVIWTDVKISLLHTTEAEPEGYIVISKDITKRKKAEEKVISSLITGKDNERARIATDLHDGLGQLLAASSYSFNNIEEDIEKLSEDVITNYRTGIGLLNKAVGEVRNIALNLMPKSISQFGLISSISSLIKTIENNSKIKIFLSENIGKKRFEQQIEINLYRITQELLNNAIKHSKASKINVQYLLIDDELVFIYEDDGVGFNYNPKKTLGDGLINIKNRVTAMSGFISINSKKGRGTSVSIELNL